MSRSRQTPVRSAVVRRGLWAGVTALGMFPALACFGADLNGAERALMQGRVDETISILQPVVSQDPHNGKAHLLLCRAFYSEMVAEEAVSECEAALSTLSDNSSAQDWMGRAYGLKASNAGPIEGYKLAKHVKTAFEAAVRLDPQNSDAAGDLGEFYIEAPGIVGGGVEKAEALADSIQGPMPQAAHRIRGLVAQHEKDYATAEKEFRAAVGVAGRPDAWSDLALFYAGRKDEDKTVDAVRHCLAVDKANDAAIVDAATILELIHREPQLAQKTLRTYLDKGLKSDAQPAFRVHTELGKLLKESGDTAGARDEFSKALALASGYAPAKKAMQTL